MTTNGQKWAFSSKMQTTLQPADSQNYSVNSIIILQNNRDH